MASTFYNLDTDSNLGGKDSKDTIIASQKATKTYIDNQIKGKQDTLTAGTGITIEGNTISSTGGSIDSSLSSTSTNPVQNKVINNALNGKQDSITDLSTIRSNATNGNSAYSTISKYGDIVTHNASEFLTEHQDISGKQDKITSTNKLSADLIADGTTNKVVTSTEKSTWNGKQNAISDLATIRSNASKGATALQSSDIVSTYSATGTSAVNGTAIKAALDTLKIPTVTDTYSATSTNAMSGKAVASAISGKADINHNQASNTINAMTGYKIATSNANIATTDSLNTALGKLEYKANQIISGSITVGMLSGGSAS